MSTERHGALPGRDPLTITVKDAARATGISVQSIYELCNKKKIESVYFGRKRLVKYASLRAYVESLDNTPGEAAA